MNFLGPDLVRHPGIEKVLLSAGAKVGSKLPEPPQMNTYGLSALVERFFL